MNNLLSNTAMADALHTATILPKDLREESTYPGGEDQREMDNIENQEPTLPQISTVGHVLTGYAPLSLILLNQINFHSGVEMMRKLNHDAKKNSGKTEQDISKDTSTEDEFASCMPQDKPMQDLTKVANLVAASLVMASRLNVDDTSAWMKKEPWINTPKQVIINQLNWIADSQSETRKIQAQRFGLDMEASAIRAKMQGEVTERIEHLYAEVRSVIDRNALIAMTDEDLIEFIEDNYDFVPNWVDLVKERITKLFDNNIKKLKAGGYADMDDTLIALAKSFQK